MSLTKLVDGVAVEMTTEEEAAFEASRTLTAEQALEAERAAMSATRYQAKAALHLADLLEQVEALMALETTDKLKAFEWNEKPIFRRNSPTITWAASELGLAESQVDDLFRSAMSIEE